MRLGRYFMLVSAIVVLLTATLAGTIVFKAWQTYSEGVGGLSALATFSAALRAAEKVSIERGPMNGLVAARVPNDPEWRAKLDKARANTDASFEALAGSLGSSGIRNVAGAAAALTAMQAHLASIRARVDEIYRKPLAQRDVAAYRALLAEMISLVTALAPIESDTEARVGAEDTALVKAAYVARLAAELREFAGRLGSVFAAPMAAGKPFLSTESYAFERIAGRLNALEDQLDREIEAASLAGITQAGVAMHETFFVGAMALVDRLVAAGRSDGHYPVSASEFVTAYVPAMATILAVRDAALDEALGIAIAKRDQARTELIAAAVLGGLCIAVIGLIGLLLSRQVVSPLVRLKDAIDAASERLPYQERPDEIGDIGRALQRSGDATRAHADELGRASARLQNLLDSAPMGVAITSSGVLRWANKRTEELSDLRVGDEVRRWYVNPEDRERIVAELREKKELLSREVAVYGPGGSTRDVLISFVNYEWQGEPALLVWLVDITERKRLETAERQQAAALALARDALLHVLDSAPVGVSISRSGILRWSNRRFSELSAVRPGEQMIDWYVHPEDRARVIDELAAEGAALAKEIEVRGADGSPLVVLVSFLEHEWEGESALLAWLVDITERKRTEEALSGSINYGSRIQRSILPDLDVLTPWVAEYFVWWEPRDVVGGDVYWVTPWGDGALVALGDCTGHGVPGALMTLIATAAFERARGDVASGDVAGLLERVHQLVQHALKQDSASGEADDGLDLGLCYIARDRSRLVYAGAGLSLFVANGSGAVEEIKGDRKSIGYRRTPVDHRFTQATLDVSPGTRLYMTTDGFIDQVGGERRRSFGKRRFVDLLAANGHGPMAEEQSVLRAHLLSYQGEESRRDDVSVIGMRL